MVRHLLVLPAYAGAAPRVLRESLLFARLPPVMSTKVVGVDDYPRASFAQVRNPAMTPVYAIGSVFKIDKPVVHSMQHRQES
jgi:hypothetical protein